MKNITSAFKISKIMYPNFTFKEILPPALNIKKLLLYLPTNLKISKKCYHCLL